MWRNCLVFGLVWLRIYDFLMWFFLIPILMKTKSSLLSLVSILAMTSYSGAAVLLDYVSVASTSNPTIAATHVASGLSGTALSAGTGITANSGASYNWSGWNEVSSAAAISGGDVFTWGFTVGVGVLGSVDLSSIDIRYDRSSTGPPNAEISYSVGAGSFSTFFTDNAVNANGENNSIDLSGISGLQGLGVGSVVVFRLVGWGASSSAGTFDLENTVNFNDTTIQINGTVPETSAALLGAFGLFGLLRRRR